MKSVLTIHGISSAGQWQDDLGKILACHFKHIPIKYRTYRYLGALKLVSDPWALGAGGLALLVAHARKVDLPIGVVAVGLVALGFAGSVVRRRITFRQVKKKIDVHMMYGEVPHLIAHSFGTYLACQTLNFPENEFDVMILTGSVLRRRFWAFLRSKAAVPADVRRYSRVRNEKCLRDRVAQAAFFLYGLIPGMGHSGYAGFTEKPGLVHSATNAWEICAECATDAAPIHNVTHSELGHSDLFISRLHAVRIWLPVLWGIEPKEYDQFLKLCRLAASLQADRDYPRLANVEIVLHTKTWAWADGLSIPQILERQLAARYKRFGRIAAAPLDDLLSMGTELVWQAVEDGAQSALAADEPRCDSVKALFPMTALVRAAEAVC